MTQPVLISLYSLMSTGQLIAFMTGGYYSDEGDSISLNFEESHEFMSPGSMAKIAFHSDKSLSIGRDDFTIMHLSDKQWFLANFTEDGSTIDLSVYPTKLEYKLSPDEGYLDMHYQMNFGEVSSHVQMFIQYKSSGVS